MSTLSALAVSWSDCGITAEQAPNLTQVQTILDSLLVDSQIVSEGMRTEISILEARRLGLSRMLGDSKPVVQTDKGLLGQKAALEKICEGLESKKQARKEQMHAQVELISLIWNEMTVSRISLQRQCIAAMLSHNLLDSLTMAEVSLYRERLLERKMDSYRHAASNLLEVLELMRFVAAADLPNEIQDFIVRNQEHQKFWSLDFLTLKLYDSGVSLATFSNFETVLIKLKEEYDRIMLDLLTTIKEIKFIQEELQSHLPDDLLHDLDEDLVPDLALRAHYAEKLSKLQSFWGEYRETTINDLLLKLRDLWSSCHLPESAYEPFLASLGDLYSTSSLRILKGKVSQLTLRYSTQKPVLDMIFQRKDLITKMLAFEITAKDPRRLFRSSFQVRT